MKIHVSKLPLWNFSKLFAINGPGSHGTKKTLTKLGDFVPRDPRHVPNENRRILDQNDRTSLFLCLFVCFCFVLSVFAASYVNSCAPLNDQGGGFVILTSCFALATSRFVTVYISLDKGQLNCRWNDLCFPPRLVGQMRTTCIKLLYNKMPGHLSGGNAFWMIKERVSLWALLMQRISFLS